MDIRGVIADFAEANGLVAGVCSAKPLPPDARLVGIPFSTATEEARRDPGLLLNGAKSMIVLGQGYAKEAETPMDAAARGVFSAMAVGEDYHTSMARHLRALRDVLLRECAFESVVHVDTGPLCERGFTLRAGLGVRGLNGMVLSPRFGAFWNIGLLVTTLEMAGDAAVADFVVPMCEGCGRCVEACPGGALSAAGVDYTKCASYISQKKGELEVWEAETLGKALYGCDVCAEVCPHSVGVPREVVAVDAMMPRVEDVLALTNKTFQEKYGGTAIGWRGAAVLKRNAENTQGHVPENAREDGIVLGLKRGDVRLYDHDEKWEKTAADSITFLKSL